MYKVQPYNYAFDVYIARNNDISKALKLVSDAFIWSVNTLYWQKLNSAWIRHYINVVERLPQK
jgi:hypothetical protein